jgi:hypothetical protein
VARTEISPDRLEQLNIRLSARNKRYLEEFAEEDGKTTVQYVVDVLTDHISGRLPELIQILRRRAEVSAAEADEVEAEVAAFTANDATRSRGSPRT